MLTPVLPTDFIDSPVDKLPTPCLTLDRALLEANLQRMQAFATAHGKGLRPHAKSHKCSQIALRQLALGAVGICAAKLSEAEALHRAGVTNLLVTGPIVTPEAHCRLLGLAANDRSLIVTLDNEENARAISEEVSREGLTLNCLLDLDIGQQRTGIAPDRASAFASLVASLPGLRLIGLQAYAGHLQHVASLSERQMIYNHALAMAEGAFHQLPGHDLSIFTVGGTGSHEFDVTFPSVTEIQPGSYALMDADYLAVEHPSPPYALALTIQTTVMSANQPDFVTIDAGLKAIYRDGPPPLVVRTSPAIEGPERLVYDWFGDEYGRITAPAEARPLLRPGARVEMAVSHCDPTVNLFDTLFVTEEGVVKEVWPIDLRGCSY